MGSVTDEDVGSGDGIELGDLRKCRIHGLLFDGEITEACPLCERERTDRLAEMG